MKVNREDLLNNVCRSLRNDIRKIKRIASNLDHTPEERVAAILRQTDDNSYTGLIDLLIGE